MTQDTLTARLLEALNRCRAIHRECDDHDQNYFPVLDLERLIEGMLDDLGQTSAGDEAYRAGDPGPEAVPFTRDHYERLSKACTRAQTLTRLVGSDLGDDVGVLEMAGRDLLDDLFPLAAEFERAFEGKGGAE